MPGYTAVDLSKLPSPAIVEPIDFESIFGAMLADLRARDASFDALVESDPAYAILQVAAYRELNLRHRVNDAARAVMLASAHGADLDQLGALLGVTRLLLDPGDPDQGIEPTMESDTDFRRRITLAPEGYSVAGPEGAYVYHALSADKDVLDASATSPSPGEVIVTVLSRQGDGTAAQDLLDAVNAALSADDVRPLTDHVTVQSATVTNYQVTATIYTYAGPDAAVVIAAARERLDDYIEQSFRLGRDVAVSGIYGALQTTGVQHVELASPTEDVIVDRAHVAHCTAIAITNGGVDE
jgi:phage-related baseplate assembly protein